MDGLVRDAEQFDDLTMLCLEYRGSGNAGEPGEEREFPASLDELGAVLSFLEQRLEEAGCPLKTQTQIALAAEEVFVNIASYAYAPRSGSARVRIACPDDPKRAVLTFCDRGVPFDPLKAEDPDVTLPAEEREIGGLGIFMTKKTMDELHYEYRDGQNRLTLVKRF